MEVEAVDRLRRGAEYMRSVSDITSAKLFEAGEQLYLAQLLEQPSD